MFRPLRLACNTLELLTKAYESTGLLLARILAREAASRLGLHSLQTIATNSRFNRSCVPAGTRRASIVFFFFRWH